MTILGEGALARLEEKQGGGEMYIEYWLIFAMSVFVVVVPENLTSSRGGDCVLLIKMAS